MKISKRTIKERTTAKTNTELVETITAARKNSAWAKTEVARYLSSSTRRMPSVNLTTLEKHAEEGDTIIVPGKVLGSGSISKKIKVFAFKFSEQAEEKLKAKKCETGRILDQINKNSKAEGVRVVI